MMVTGKRRTRTVQGKIPIRTVLGIPIAALRLKEIPSVIVSLIEEGGKKSFFYVDAHLLNLANKDPFYKKIFQNATFAHAAGMGPIFASSILGQSLPERTPPEDFIDDIFAKASEKKWSFYLLGGEKHVAEKAAQRLRKRFPKLRIVGYSHGFFTNNSEIVEKINAVKPDIILVGMGAPRQEKWIAENINNVNTNTFWAVGGLFEILSGKRKRAPIWMQKIGMEWFFRLLQEPRRLWKRYLFGNIVFLFTILREKESFFHKANR